MVEMTLDEIAKSHWSSADAATALAGLAREHLDTLAPDVTLTTTGLIRALGGTLEQIKPLANSLTVARNGGLLDRCYDRGKKGAFGKESVIWHRKRELTLDERRAMIAKDMADADRLAAKEAARKAPATEEADAAMPASEDAPHGLLNKDAFAAYQANLFASGMDKIKAGGLALARFPVEHWQEEFTGDTWELEV